jgi:hypothetical protein
MKKMPLIPPHTHGDSIGDTTTAPHHADHETGGADALTAIAAEIVTSGTLDGDRLPAISTTKKGAVPAVTAGATELLAKWLKDTGLFARIVQANCDGLKTTDTPQFAGLGVGVAGAEDAIELIEGATIGDASGAQIKYNKAAELIEVLDADLNVGDTPTQPGTGGTWETSYDSDRTAIYSFGQFNGALLAGSYGDLNAKIFRFYAGSWAQVYVDANEYGYCAIVPHVGKVYTCGGYGTGRIYESADGITWALKSTIAANNIETMLSHNGLLWIGLRMYGGTIHYSTDNGATWNLSLTPEATTYASRGLITFNNDLYVACYEASGSIRTFIYKHNGSTWSLVYTSANNVTPYCSYVWNGKLYFGCDGGRILSTSNGADFTLSADVTGSGNVYALYEYNAKLLAGSSSDIYETVDGTTWTVFHDDAGNIYALSVFGGTLYSGTSDAGKIKVYTDNTYIPAPNGKIYGHLTVHGQFRPGDMAGVEGDILLSGGAAHGSWLARGTTGQYVGGVTDGKPIYKAIPASDVTFDPNSYTEATDVQAAIEEVQADFTRLRTSVTSISEFRYKVNLEDDATYTLPFELVAPGGWGMVFGGNNEYSFFRVSGSGVVSLMNNTANVVANADTDGYFCIGTAAGQDPLVFKNRLGVSANLFLVMWYMG